MPSSENFSSLLSRVAARKVEMQQFASHLRANGGENLLLARYVVAAAGYTLALFV